MKGKIKNISCELILECLFGLVLVAQIIMLFKYNLSDIRESMDADFSFTLYHYMQVIKNGTLNLEGWVHTTTLELDATMLFALPMYYLVHDIFLAVGISNLIIAFLYILVIYKLLSLANVRRSLIFMAITLVLSPYAFGMLDYFNMMFYGGACYSIKILIPIMLLMLIIWNEKPTKKLQSVIRIISWIFYLFLLLVSTFSSGTYVMMCGIFPIIISVLLDIWKDGSIKGKYVLWHIQLLITTIGVFLIGSKLHKIYKIPSKVLNITKYPNWDTNLRACLIAPFQILGTTTSEDIKATSVIGIFLVMKIALTFLLLFIGVINIPNLFKKTDEIPAEKFLTVMFLFNFLLLLVADSRYGANLHIEYRYMLIGIIPLFLLLSIWINKVSLSWNRFQTNAVIFILLVATMFVGVGNNKNIIKHWDRTRYAVELSDYLRELDVESVFVVDDFDTVSYLRTLNGEQKVGNYQSAIPGLQLTMCSYEDSQYGTYYGHKNALVIFNFMTLEDYFCDEIGSNYTYSGTVRWFDIYVSDEVYF